VSQKKELTAEDIEKKKLKEKKDAEKLAQKRQKEVKNIK